MREIRYAYAKINLVLNVLNKREDCFHEVDFIMSTVDIYDTLTFEKYKEDILICDGVDFDYRDNLAYKALKLMKSEFNILDNIKITLDKKIPIAAGMAGGSSDAACVINFINDYYNLNLDMPRLYEIGSRLGSDIAFCILSKNARAQGRGEIINEVDINTSGYHIVVINPGVSLPTPLVYKNLVLNNNNDEVNKFLNNLDDNNLNDLIYNDMQDSAISLCDEIKPIMDEVLDKFNIKAHLSGSGPTVFTITKDYDKANNIYNHFKDKYKHTYIAKIRG